MTQYIPNLRPCLDQALRTYEEFHEGRLTFGDYLDFVLTPEKPNSFRTVIPTRYEGELIGDFFAIGFEPQDGTGDAGTYQVGTINVPPRYQLTHKKERILPRSKKGIIAEGFFPLFSFEDAARPHLFAASLEELTIDNSTSPSTVHYAWNLGQNPADYRRILSLHEHVQPLVHITVGSIDGERFGDPHSIYYGNDFGRITQVVGFLAIRDDKYIPLTKNWKPPLSR